MKMKRLWILLLLVLMLVPTSHAGFFKWITGRAASQCSLLSEDFKNVDGWDFSNAAGIPVKIGNEWNIIDENGDKVLKGTGHNWANTGDEKLTNYVFKTNIKVMQGGVHVNFRRGYDGRYFLGFGEEGLYLNKQFNQWSEFADLERIETSIALNQWHTLVVEAKGGNIKVYVDDVLKIDHADPNPLASGSIAFETLDDSVVYFDDIKVDGDCVQEAIEPSQDAIIETPTEEVIQPSKDCYFDNENIVCEDYKITTNGIEIAIKNNHPDGIMIEDLDFITIGELGSVVGDCENSFSPKLLKGNSVIQLDLPCASFQNQAGKTAEMQMTLIASEGEEGIPIKGSIKGIVQGSLTETCTDTDGGKDYYTHGIVQYQNTGYNDACGADGKHLLENFCLNGERQVEEFECPDRCIDGVCAEENLYNQKCGNYSVILEPSDFTPDETHSGTLIIDEAETRIIDGKKFLQQGNVYIKDRAKLIIRNSQFALGRGDIPTIHAYIFVEEGASLEINNSLIFPEKVPGGVMGGLVVVSDRGKVDIINSPTSIHYFDVSEGAELNMVNSQMIFTIGGLLQVTGGTANLVNSKIGAIGLSVPADAHLSLNGLRSGAYFESWKVQDIIPEADYNVILKNSCILKDDFPGGLKYGPYERGWLFFLDPSAHVRINNSELRKVFFELYDENAAFNNLKIGLPSSLNYRDLILRDVTVMGEWPFYMENSNTTFTNSNYLFLQPTGNSNVKLIDSQMVEFIPRNFFGTMIFENGNWISAGEIIGGEESHSMSNNFTIRGSLKIAPELKFTLQWRNATVTREYDVIVNDENGNPIRGVLVKIDGKKTITDNYGKTKFNLMLNEFNYNKPHKLEVYKDTNLILQEDIDFFSETPIKVGKKDNDKPNVVLIYDDTLRADHLGVYGYSRETSPNIDQLAVDGVLFKNHISQGPTDPPAIPSFLASAYQPNLGDQYPNPLIADNIITLPEAMREGGYKTAGIVSGKLWWSNPSYGLQQGFDTFIVPGDDIIQNEALSWIDQNSGSPFFLMIQYAFTHGPYDAPEPYKKMFVGDSFYNQYPDAPGICNELWEGDGCIPGIVAEGGIIDIDYYIAKFDGEIIYTDTLVGEIIQKLKDKGIYENTIFIFAGDHGESLGAHNTFFTHKYLYDDTIKPPLIIRYPKFIAQNKIITNQVQAIDLYPTILELTTTSMPANIGGKSMVPLIDGTSNRECNAYSFEGFRSAIRTNKWKYLLSEEEYGQSEELYDLENDPAETKNILSEQPEVASNFRTKIQSCLQGNCPSDCEGGCVCTAMYDPVCGADGKTYSNSCSAGCGNVNVACKGECPCSQISGCSGCLNNEGRCIPYGIRAGAKYCDLSGSFVGQKKEGKACGNNFECSTNICINDKCIGKGVWESFLKWFNKIFGKKRI